MEDEMEEGRKKGRQKKAKEGPAQAWAGPLHRRAIRSARRRASSSAHARFHM